jgi:pimeloyl-ACP methyl ester carboxylesterase
MASSRRLFKSILRLCLPIAFLLIFAFIGSAIWLLYQTSQAPKNAYLITPDKYGQLSSRAAQVTEEQWTNADGSAARGWLLRGMPGSPAVVMLHAYGADRSYVLNLGVKINEATDFTILMPDQRGHGEKPPSRFTSFGGCESDDTVAAIAHLRGLKADESTPLVAGPIGLFGVEMGAIAAISAAAKEENVKALVLDSIPASSDALLGAVIGRRYPFASSVTSRFATLGAPAYFFNGCYRNDAVCDTAKRIADRQVLLLAGGDNSDLQTSTAATARCFPNTTRVESKTDLYPSGTNLVNASLQQFEEYDNRVVGFFRQALAPAAPVQ